MPQAGLFHFSPLPRWSAWTESLGILLGGACRRTPQGKVFLGEGQPVIVFPDLGNGPAATAQLRWALTDAGFECHDWGLGVDNGPGAGQLGRWLHRLEETVIDVFERARQPVALVGWGLSGLYAREIAKRANPLVRQVITLGTPLNPAAAPRQACGLLQVIERAYGGQALDIHRRLRQCPPVPFTSIYSKGDAVVPWEMSLERETQLSENIEVPGAGHDELAAHPRVIELVSHRLAQPEGRWRPFRGAGATA